MNKFQLPVGDWSGDGHDKCDYFVVETELTKDLLVYLHGQIKPMLGVDFKLLEDYECDVKPFIDQFEAAFPEGSTYSVDYNRDCLTPEDVANMWCVCIMECAVRHGMTDETHIEPTPMYPRLYECSFGYGLYW